MASEVDSPIVGWRLVAVLGVAVITVFAMVLAVRSSLAREEPRTTSLADTSFRSPVPVLESTPPTLEVALAPLASGDVMVTEVLRTDQPLTSLELRAPPPPPRSDGDGPPLVLELQADAGDVRISVPTTVTQGPWSVRLPESSNEVTLTYRLVDASRRSAAASRRALVWMRPLAYMAGPDDTTVVVTIDDVVVHNLVCPDLPLAEQLCGREQFNQWETVALPADLSTVVAQVDLPALG